MDYSIRQQQKRTIAGFHLVGPGKDGQAGI